MNHCPSTHAMVKTYSCETLSLGACKGHEAWVVEQQEHSTRQIFGGAGG